MKEITLKELIRNFDIILDDISRNKQHYFIKDKQVYIVPPEFCKTLDKPAEK